MTNPQPAQATPRSAPHWPQNFISGGLSKPQAGHFTGHARVARTCQALRKRLARDPCLLQPIQRHPEAPRQLLEDGDRHFGVLLQDAQEVPAREGQASARFRGLDSGGANAVI